MSGGMYDDDEPEVAAQAAEPPRRSRALLITVGLLVVLFLAFTGFSAFWTERLWFSSVGYQEVFTTLVRTKIGLFMTVSFFGWFVGMHLLYRFNTLQAGNGVGNEFLYIIAAVVGGTLLTGGYGNAIGVAIGAFIFGMTTQGIVYAGWDPSWFRFFLGAMLLLAVMVNLYVKRLSTARKVG